MTILSRENAMIGWKVRNFISRRQILLNHQILGSSVETWRLEYDDEIGKMTKKRDKNNKKIIR